MHFCSRSTYSSEEKLKKLQKHQPKHERKRTRSNLTYDSDSDSDNDDYSSYYDDSDVFSDKDSDESSDGDDYNSYDKDSDLVSDKYNDESSDNDDYSIYDEDSDVDNNMTEENKNYIKETIEIIKNKIPEKIVGANVYDDQITFIIKFQGDDDDDNEGEKIQAKVAKILWPKIVIDFFEKHLKWI